MGPCLGCSGAAWTAVCASFRVRVPGLRGCCTGEVLDRGLYMYLALRLFCSLCKAGLTLPWILPLRLYLGFSSMQPRGPPAHRQHAARAAPPPVAECLSPSYLEVRTQPL